MNKKSIPHEFLACLMDYNPESGKLIWKSRGLDMFHGDKMMSASSRWKAWNKKFSGKEAFVGISGGYKQGSAFGMTFLAHRVAYAIHNKISDFDFIDHINGDRTDNRIQNLRCVSHAENTRNQSLNSRNTSGVNGVSFCKRNGMWCVRVRYKIIGYYSALSDAAEAREAANIAFGFHANHGKQRALTHTILGRGVK